MPMGRPVPSTLEHRPSRVLVPVLGTYRRPSWTAGALLRRSILMTSALTPTRQPESVGSAIVSTLEDAWTAIRQHHPEIPAVVVTLATRGRVPKHGHYAAMAWRTGDAETSELFVAGESLEQGAEFVLAILLHEATHGLADARGVKDTSRQGRYHNRRYAELAGELGLDVEHNGGNHGWNNTSLTPGTIARYAATIAALDKAITGYRHPQKTTGGSSNGIVLVCECPHRLRTSTSSALALVGRLRCPDCGQAFVVPAQDPPATPEPEPTPVAPPEVDLPYCDRCGWRTDICAEENCPPCDGCGEYADECICDDEYED